MESQSTRPAPPRPPERTRKRRCGSWTLTTRAYFTDQFHFSYDSVMAQAWTTFLYCYCGWTDFAPLEKGHRLKRMNAHYQATLERCRTPDWARLELEKELRKTGLLTSETPRTGAVPSWQRPSGWP
nr:hypothetical protein [uncultured Oscillibacter sp.]